MELCAADVWVGERDKNHEFGLGPWTAVTRSLVIQGFWVLLAYGSGKETQVLNLGWALGLQ